VIFEMLPTQTPATIFVPEKGKWLERTIAMAQYRKVSLYLASTGPGLHGFKMTHSIVKNMIQTGPNFVSPESMQNIACFGQKPIEIEQKEVTI